MLPLLVLQPWEAPSGMYHLFSRVFEFDPEESYGATSGMMARFPALDPSTYAPNTHGYTITANVFESDEDAMADVEAVVLARGASGDGSPTSVTTTGPSSWVVRSVDDEGVSHILVAYAIGNLEVIVEGHGEEADQDPVVGIAERLYQRAQGELRDTSAPVPASDLEAIEQFADVYAASLADGLDAFIRFVAAHADPDLRYTHDDCVSSIPHEFEAVAPSLAGTELERIYRDDEWAVPFGTMRDTAPQGRTYVTTWRRPPTPSQPQEIVVHLDSHHISIRDGQVYMYPDCERGAIQGVKSAMGW